MSNRQWQLILIVVLGLGLAIQFASRQQTAATDRMIKDAGSNLEDVFSKSPPPK